MTKIVIGTERLPIKLWSPSPIEEGDSKALAQFRDLANHPLAFKHVCGMPDFHGGYGMPIGGVLATIGGVIPNAVGVDIGCGMIAVKTQMRADRIRRDKLEKLRLAIHERVPVGFSRHDKTQSFGNLAKPEETWDNQDFSVPAQGFVATREWNNAATQLGTLGGGNHFIEIQKDEEGFVWIMLHSGSRNVGLKVCEHYHGLATEFMERYNVTLPDTELSFLAEGLPQYEHYLHEMRWCMSYAERNRELMLQAVYAALEEVRGVEIEEVLKVDTHHNFAQMENHFGKDVLVHRKGAVRATGLVTIPGSMGTASFIGRGLDPEESFNTCSHGAGRQMSRSQANKRISPQEARESMKHVVFEFSSKRGKPDHEEMPRAYKDIDAVMEAQADLVEPLYRLVPLAVVKG